MRYFRTFLAILTLLSTFSFGQGTQFDRINARGAITTPDLITSSTPVVDVRSKGAVAGGEICTPLASALAAAHTAGGGTVIVPLAGAVTCTSNPFASLTGNENIEIDWGPVQITTSAQWYINANGVVNKAVGRTGTRLIANTSTFPTSTPLLKIGDNVSTLIFGTRFVGGWRFTCSSVSGCNLQLNGLNEQSGLFNYIIDGSGSAAALVINNNVVTSGHFRIEDGEIQTTGANDGITVNGANAGSSAMFSINRLTCNNTGGTTGLACVHAVGANPATGIVTVRDIHMEGFADNVYFDTNASGEVYTADCTGTCTNVIHINSSGKISAIGLNAWAGTNIVKNDNSACTVPQSELTLAAYLQNSGQVYAFGSATSAIGNVCGSSVPRYRIESSATSGSAGRTTFDQVDGNINGFRWQSPGSTDAGILGLSSLAAGVPTTRYTFDSSGNFVATGNVQGVNLIVPGGGNPATFGDIRMRSQGTIRALNNAGGANNILVSTDASDNELLYNIIKITATGSIDASAGTGFLKIKDQGSCTMSAGTCSAQSLGHTYTAAPNCFANWNNSGTLTGILKVPSTTTTVTPASSVGTDTAVVNWFCVGS